MKYILEYENFLFEIGDSSAGAYNWELVSKKKDRIVFAFTTNSGALYNVEFINMNDDEWGLDHWEWAYSVNTGQGRNFKQVVNRGEVFKVMATNMEIIDHFIKKYLDKKKAHALSFTGGFKPTRGAAGPISKRTRMYIHYFHNKFKNYEITQDGNNVIMIIPPR